LKKEDLLKDIKETITDRDIKNLFHQSLQDVSLTENSKNKLYNIPINTKKQSFLQNFLEREIIIPLPSLAIFTSLAVVLVGMYIGNLILIKDIPEPRYEIINIQTMEYNPYVSQGKGR